jgi:uncharacterized membrane protein YhaH (DUF805 family)
MNSAQIDTKDRSRSVTSLNPFRGRCSRHMFLIYLMMHLTIVWFVFNSDDLLFRFQVLDTVYRVSLEKNGWELAVVAVTALLIAIPAIVRRLHDIGASARWALLVATPAQPLLLLALLYWPGTHLSNSHGGLPRDFRQEIAWLLSGAKSTFTVEAAARLVGLSEPPHGPPVRVIAARYMLIGLSLILIWMVNENFVTISSFWDPPAILLVGGVLSFWGFYCWLVAPYRREKLTEASNEQAVTTEAADSGYVISQSADRRTFKEGLASERLNTEAKTDVGKNREGRRSTFIGSAIITVVLFSVWLSSPNRIAGSLTTTALSIPSAAQGAVVGASGGALLGLTLGSLAAPAGAAASMSGTITGAVLGGTAGAVVGIARDRIQQNIGSSYLTLTRRQQELDFSDTIADLGKRGLLEKGPVLDMGTIRRNVAIEQAVAANPDEEARIRAIADRMKMPSSMVAAIGLMEAEKRILKQQVEQSSTATPPLSKAFERPDFAKIARDDFARLGPPERALREWFGAVELAANKNALGKLVIRRLAGRALKPTELFEIDRLKARNTVLQQQLEMTKNGAAWTAYTLATAADEESHLIGLAVTAGLASVSLETIMSALMASSFVPGTERYVQRAAIAISDQIYKVNPEFIEAAGYSLIEWGWLAD